MNDDAELLRRYAREGAEDAFTELVRRHVDLVFGAALRRTGGNSHRAADVAQHVFTQLAREARKLSGHAVLPAWLHTATRNAAVNIMISEQRRRIREQEAVTLDATFASNEPNPEWDRLRPVLDAAIDELPEPDRVAVILRFLQRRSFSSIGATLHVSEDAARMRTDRALDKLRTVLARRGITSTSAALAAIVAGQSAVSAPAGLTAILVTKSLAAAATGAGILTFSSLMSTPTLTTVAAAALISFGAGTYFGFSRNLDAPPPVAIETPRHSQMIASLRQDNLSLKAEVARLTADVSQLTSANLALKAQRATPATPPLAQTKATLEASSRHKATLNNLRQIAAARDQFMLEHGRPPLSVDELVGEKKYIRRLIPVDGENYAGISMLPNQPMMVVTASGATVTYDPGELPKAAPVPSPAMQRVNELGKRIGPLANKAVEAYRAANNGNMPPNEQAILPYFATPSDGADFVEFLEAQRKARGD